MMKQRYEIGLEKLDHAASQVGEMQKQLTLLQPDLIVASKEVEVIVNQVERESLDVAEVEKVVKIDEAKAEEQAAAAMAIKAECDADLSEALPLLQTAQKALETINPADISFVKTMKNPPAAIKLVMEGVCMLKV